MWNMAKSKLVIVNDLMTDMNEVMSSMQGNSIGAKIHQNDHTQMNRFLSSYIKTYNFYDIWSFVYVIYRSFQKIMNLTEFHLYDED